MNQRPMRVSWKRLLVVLAVVGAAVLAGLAIPGLRPRDFLHRRLQAQMEAVPDRQAAEILGKIAGLGESALPDVVAALGDQREPVAAAADQLISQQLERWRLLSTGDASPKIARLSRLLAENSKTMNANGRRAAAEIAVRLLVWPVDRTRINAGDLIAHCEQVLTNAPPRLATDPVALASAVGTDADNRRPLEVVPIGPGAGPLNVPGGDLPIEFIRVPVLPHAHKLPDASRPSDDPRTVRVDEPPGLLPSAQPDTTDARPPRRLLPPDAAAPSGTNGPSDNQGEPGGTTSAAGGTVVTAVRVEDLPRLGDRDVMEQLHSSDPRLAAAARQELTRRGFQEVHVQLARQLTHPDIARRRDLAIQLGRGEFAGVDARPWWLALSEDTAPSVRLAAVSAMATTTDPKLLGRLRDMNARETDRQVLRQLERVLR